MKFLSVLVTIASLSTSRIVFHNLDEISRSTIRNRTQVPQSDSAAFPHLDVTSKDMTEEPQINLVFHHFDVRSRTQIRN